jgi:hypothetical protein
LAVAAQPRPFLESLLGEPAENDSGDFAFDDHDDNLADYDDEPAEHEGVAFDDDDEDLEEVQLGDEEDEDGLSLHLEADEPGGIEFHFDEEPAAAAQPAVLAAAPLAEEDDSLELTLDETVAVDEEATFEPVLEAVPAGEDDDLGLELAMDEAAEEDILETTFEEAPAQEKDLGLDLALDTAQVEEETPETTLEEAPLEVDDIGLELSEDDVASIDTLETTLEAAPAEVDDLGLELSDQDVDFALDDGLQPPESPGFLAADTLVIEGQAAPAAEEDTLPGGDEELDLDGLELDGLDEDSVTLNADLGADNGLSGQGDTLSMAGDPFPAAGGAEDDSLGDMETLDLEGLELDDDSGLDLDMSDSGGLSMDPESTVIIEPTAEPSMSGGEIDTLEADGLDLEGAALEEDSVSLELDMDDLEAGLTDVDLEDAADALGDDLEGLDLELDDLNLDGDEPTRH